MIQLLARGSSDVALLQPDWFPLGLLLAVSVLYVRAIRIVASRGRTIGLAQIGSFYLGIALIAAATQTSIDTIGECCLLSMHMTQHMLLADLSAPLLLFGLRAPLVYFFWPRPILVAAARNRPLRAIWRQIKRPQYALSIWLVILYVWHVPVAYEAALNHYWVHGLEHASFALGAMLAWWPLLDPTHERVEGRMWKALYVVVARMVGGILGILLIVPQHQIYSYYGNRATRYGISPLTDQQLAGSIMMTIDLFIVVIGFVYFFAISAEPREKSASGERLVARLADSVEEQDAESRQ